MFDNVVGVPLAKYHRVFMKTVEKRANYSLREIRKNIVII